MAEDTPTMRKPILLSTVKTSAQVANRTAGGYSAKILAAALATKIRRTKQHMTTLEAVTFMSHQATRMNTTLKEVQGLVAVDVAESSNRDEVDTQLNHCGGAYDPQRRTDVESDDAPDTVNSDAHDGCSSLTPDGLSTAVVLKLLEEGSTSSVPRIPKGANNDLFCVTHNSRNTERLKRG
jgi:hypothetical protein